MNKVRERHVINTINFFIQSRPLVKSRFAGEFYSVKFPLDKSSPDGIRLLYILNDCGNLIKLPRIFQDILEQAECGRIVITVADALVKRERKVDI